MKSSFVRLIVIVALVTIYATAGCVIGHRTPPILVSFSFEPPAAPANTQYEVKYFLEHKETDPETGVTRFVPKGERTISMRSGTTSNFTWTTFFGRYQGGIWRGRARVSRQAVGGGSLFIGEGTQDRTIAFEQPEGGASLTYAFHLESDPAAANRLRVVAAP